MLPPAARRSGGQGSALAPTRSARKPGPRFFPGAPLSKVRRRLTSRPAPPARRGRKNRGPGAVLEALGGGWHADRQTGPLRPGRGGRLAAPRRVCAERGCAAASRARVPGSVRRRAPRDAGPAGRTLGPARPRFGLTGDRPGRRRLRDAPRAARSAPGRRPDPPAVAVRARRAAGDAAAGDGVAGGRDRSGGAPSGL